MLLRIFGRVQGVGFRFFTKNLAENLGLKGYVKNESDGSVTIYLEENNKKLILEFLEKLKKSHPGHIEYLKTLNLKHNEQYYDFKIKF